MIKSSKVVSLPLAGITALYATGTVTCAAETRDLVVHVSKLTPELVSTIAKVGEERSVKVSAGTDIFKVISDYCGSANARRYYLPLFIAANSQNDDIRSGKTIVSQDAELRVPACLFAEEKPTAVLATASGLQWDKPIAVSNKGALVSVDSDGTVAKWFPKSSDAASLNPTVVASVLPGQSVNYDRLTPTAARDFPKELDDQGPSLITQVDSRRLADPTVKSMYDKLLKQTIAATTQLLPADAPSPAKKGLSLSTSDFERAVRTQDVLASNQITDFTKLKTGAAIVSSDFSPGQYSVKLRPDIDGKAAALQVVASLPSGVDANIAVTSKYRGYIAQQPTAAEAACVAAPASQWPIDVDELRRVLSLRGKAGNKPTAGKLLIVDTGFPPGRVGTVPFVADFFVRKVGNVIDPTHEPYLWTTVQPPEPPQYFYPTMKNADHGIGVLTLALGGPEVLKQNLVPPNVISQGGNIISLMAYKSISGAPELSVNGDAAMQSLSGGNWGQAAVAGVNLSLQFSTEYASPNFNGALDRHPIVLYVFAAGNDSKDLESETIQPADWGGDHNTNAITVGAANPDGTYWIRSNWGAKRVDLAAPGCAVPSLGWDSATGNFKDVRWSGTSLAAPLVSFVGNLLRDLTDPARIKSRILSSGQYFSELSGKVVSKRMLDAPTALALQFDAIRDNDGRLRLGRIVNWPTPGYSICSAKRPVNEVAQISRADNPATVSLVLKNKYDSRVISFPTNCSLAADTELANISFREVDETAPGIAWKAAEPLDFRNLRSITLCEMCLNP